MDLPIPQTLLQVPTPPTIPCSQRTSPGPQVAPTPTLVLSIHPSLITYHFQLIHDVQLTDLTKVLVKDLHKAVDELKDAQLILYVEHRRG